MNTVTQTMKFRQSLLSYAEKHGVTQAAIKYNVNRQYIYRWKRRYNGDIQSLANRSHRPHHHPNQHTEAEWCCTIKADIENSKSQYIEKDKQEATKDGSESTKIQHGI